jgi:hypothetical protein
MIEDIRFGSTVRCVHRDRKGNLVESVEGVFIGAGCGLVVPNEQPDNRLSIPLDDLEKVES